MHKKNQDHDDEDIVIEEEYSEDSQVGAQYEKKIKTIKDKLETCQKEKEEYLLGWQRAQADFINYKKNNASIFTEAKESATTEMVESLLPILDSFDMALAGTFDDAFKKWLTGFEYVHAQFKRVLAEQGIEEMNPVGEPFSPQEHEAVEEVATDDEKLDHTVATVILKGYRTSKRIVRAPQVKVYKSEK
jgi:molecular chaperone GrpE